MPSIYTTLKKSDRKYISTQKARIRREFLDVKKQEEMISELYKRVLPNTEKAKEAKPAEEKETIKVKAEKPFDVVQDKPKESKPKKTKAKKTA